MDSPVFSAVLSGFICGLGQINNGKMLKGLTLGVLWLISLSLVSAGVGLITTPIVWIYSVYSAYREADKLNADAYRAWKKFDDTLDKYKGR